MNIPASLPVMLSQGAKPRQTVFFKEKPTLSNFRIWEYEHNRERVQVNPVLYNSYRVVTFGLDMIFNEKPIERFWFLENVARMPYFSYVACIHFYETIGVWSPDADLRQNHYEQEINETNHLIVMDALGGGEEWYVRFLARHAAMSYYLVLLALYFSSPDIAYKCSELLEMHAVDTYLAFLNENHELLKKTKTPKHLKKKFKGARSTMFDVFIQIVQDEQEHALEMRDLIKS